MQGSLLIDSLNQSEKAPISWFILHLPRITVGKAAAGRLEHREFSRDVLALLPPRARNSRELKSGAVTEC